MSEQLIGDGANVFITIVAVLVGFAAAIGYVDRNKIKEKERGEGT